MDNNLQPIAVIPQQQFNRLSRVRMVLRMLGIIAIVLVDQWAAGELGGWARMWEAFKASGKLGDLEVMGLVNLVMCTTAIILEYYIEKWWQWVSGGHREWRRQEAMRAAELRMHGMNTRLSSKLGVWVNPDALRAEVTEAIFAALDAYEALPERRRPGPRN